MYFCEFTVPGGLQQFERPVFLVGCLATVGYLVQRRSKANVDMALEKYGAGRTWSSFGDDVKVQRVTHQRWAKEGKWDALKSVLKALRASDEGTKPRIHARAAELAPSECLSR